MVVSGFIKKPNGLAIVSLIVLFLFLQDAVCVMQKSKTPRSPQFDLSEEKMKEAGEKIATVKDAALNHPGYNKLHSSLWSDAGLEMDTEVKEAFKMKPGSGMNRKKRSTNSNSPDIVKVEIRAHVTPELLDKIRELGGVIIFSSVRFSSITAEIGSDKIGEVSLLPDVISIRPALDPITHQSKTDPEGVNSHRVPQTVQNFPAATGKGIKVAVISDSVDNLQTAQSEGFLPDVTVLSGQSGLGKTGEGTAMLEIVHNMAPDATLYFATGATSEASFAENILALADAGCKVIVDDLIYASEPVYEDGPVAQAVYEVAQQGVAYFSSAGNSGNPTFGSGQAWEGDYSGTNSLNIGGYLDTHLFGTKTYSTVTDPTIVTLQWSDPFNSPVTDLDLIQFDQSGNLVAVSTNTMAAFEYLTVDKGTWAIVVARKSGPANIMIRLYAQSNPVTPGTGGEIFGHAAVVECFAIAAIPALYLSNYYTEIVGDNINLSPEKFTSAGPRQVFYNLDGSAVTPGVITSSGGTVRQKPDFTAADGVTTSLSGFDPFYGTSAAAPHAAAIAVLMLSVQNGLTPDLIRENLQKASLDIQDPGYDYVTGYGVIDALSAVAYALNTTVPSTATSGTPNAGLTLFPLLLGPALYILSRL